MKGIISFLMLLVFFVLFCGSLYAQNEKRVVAVTFDDLPFVNHLKFSPQDQKERTLKLLKVFENFSIPAVGFVNEYKLFVNDSLKNDRLSVLNLWISNNLELGNHTFSHPSLNKVSAEEYKADILKGEKITKPLLAGKGKNILYFRYPYLQKGNEEIKKKEIENYLLNLGYINAPVTLDNSDWVFARAYDNAIEENDSVKMKMLGENYIKYMNTVFEYFEKQSKLIFNREIKQILLLHANAINSDYFDELCIMIKNRNYNFISLEEALTDPVYDLEETYVGNWGFSWINRWAITQGRGKEFYKDEPEPSEEIFKLAGIDY